MNISKSKLKSLSWDEVENAIRKEINWLEQVITDSPFNNEDKVCSRCTFRKIAMLILYGKIKVKDIKSSISLWGEEHPFNIGKPHGGEWHSDMMKLIASYFKSLKYEVLIEPNLNFGRADLGIYKKGKRNLFTEVGTVSISKLLSNLQTMKGADITVVLDSHHAVEFSILDVDYLRHPYEKKINKISF